METGSQVVTLSQADEAFFDAWFYIRPAIFGLCKSACQCFDVNRSIGDGFGLGFGDRPIPRPFNTTETGWKAWNPPGPEDPTQLGVLVQDLVSGEGWKPRWFTIYDDDPFPFPTLQGPILKSMRTYFIESLRQRKLSQDKLRSKGVWTDGDSKNRMRIRIPHR